MAKLTDKLTINGIKIKNRIAMAPMNILPFGENFTTVHSEHYLSRARGGAGLIILQSTPVSGAVSSTMKWTPENISILENIVRICRGNKTHVIMQLACNDMDINKLSTSEINSMQTDMIEAGIIVSKLGFDGIEFHFAHGYTLSKFIDKFHNRRTDQYGGSLENRVRILTEIIPEIRKSIDKQIMIGVRMGEYIPGSIDGIRTAQAFEHGGVDFLHISYGMYPLIIPPTDDFKGSALAQSGVKIKKELRIPVISVGEINTEERVRYLIENDFVDMVAVGRGMLADADFANHVINSEPVNSCRNCKSCMWFTDPSKCPAKN